MKNSLSLTICTLALLISLNARAVPVVDTAIGTVTPLPVTVVPDDKDPNLYYYFPAAYAVSRDASGKASFGYHEYSGLFGDKGWAVMTMAAEFDSNLAAKLAEVKTQNPAATFSPIPLTQGLISEGKIDLKYLSDSECQDAGGVIGQEIGCKFLVKSKYRSAFIKGMRASQIHQFYYNYEFAAIRNGTVGVFKHSVPIKFGDLGTGAYFFDKNGNPL